MNDYGHLYEGLDRHGERLALIADGDRSLSYRSLLDLGDRFVERVTRRSLAFVLCQNSVASVAGYLGLMRKQCVPLLLNQALDPALLSALIERYQPRFLLTPKANAAAQSGTIVSECENYQLNERENPGKHPVHDSLALLLTTSGSTGSPKLVRLSQKNLASNAAAIAQSLGISQDDRALTTLPMNYAFGLSILNSHFLRGATVLLTDAALTENRFWETLRTHRATTFGGVPYTFEMLNKLRFDKMDLPSLRYLTQAGGKLDPTLAAAMGEACERKRISLILMYGQTEATARMSYLPAPQWRVRPGSIGQAIPGGKFWLQAADGSLITQPEVPGELIYQGENVCLGYATTPADLCLGDENQGILRTGDIAKRDAQGFFYVVGRGKRFLKLFGHRVGLDELESLLRDAGYECACTGSDDSLSVFVVGAKAEDVKRFITTRTSLSAGAFQVAEVASLPRNEVGKTLYSELEKIGGTRA